MSKHVLKAIPELVNEKIISGETADRIIGYYDQKRESEPNHLVVVLGVLGALLVGGGITLIVAHNWDELSRVVKTVVSFLPLVLGQLLCAYALYKQKNTVWKESGAVILFFAIGVSISLISQVYQVNGSLSGFLLTWMLLALPLTYLLSSSTVALLCIGGITWFACERGYFERPGNVPVMYAAAMLFLLPFYLRLFRSNPRSNTVHLFNWFIAISITICLGSFTRVQAREYEWLFLLYVILFCMFYSIGQSSTIKERRLMNNPFLIIGITGILGILLIWSFKFPWIDLERSIVSQALFKDALPYLVIAGIIANVYLTWRNFKTTNGQTFDPTGFSFVILLLLLVTMRNLPAAATFVINAWILFIAVYFIRRGSRENHLGILNFGLVILASLAVSRFFDESIPFIWRGLLFVATGAGFFIANYLTIKKRKQILKA